MNMREWLKQTTPEQRQALADAAGTTVGYFWQIAGRHTLPSPKLCLKLERLSSGQLTKERLRPDIFGLAKD